MQGARLLPTFARGHRRCAMLVRLFYASTQEPQTRALTRRDCRPPVVRAFKAFSTAGHFDRSKTEEESSNAASSASTSTFQDPRQEILAAALPMVPTHGWTEEALAAGAASLGFPAVAHGMFARGGIELVEHVLAQIDSAWLAELEARKEELAALPSSRERLEKAIQCRLRLIAPHLAQWPQAMALSLSPQHLETTARGLAEVADELCVISGEDSVDVPNWYAHRATVCSVYIATELFFLTDYSDDYRDTWAFLDRRLQDVEALSHAPRNVQEGVLAFQTAASAMASALSSLAQPAVVGVLEKVPLTGTVVTVVHAVLANLAAMAPTTPSPFDQEESKKRETETSTEFGPSTEIDPYAEKIEENEIANDAKKKST